MPWTLEQALLMGDVTEGIVYSSMSTVDLSSNPAPSSRLPSASPETAPMVSPAFLTMPKEQVVSNPEAWRTSGFPQAVYTCVLACSKGGCHIQMTLTPSFPAIMR